jgi:hypothetical protein
MGTYSYIYIHAYCSNRRTAGTTPADGGWADTPAGGGQADTPVGAKVLMGIHACTIGGRRMRREPNGEAGGVHHHGRCIYGNRYKFVTISLLKRFRNGRFTSETAMRRFQERNGHLDPKVVKKGGLTYPYNTVEPLHSTLGQQEAPLLTDQSPQGFYMKNAVLYRYNTLAIIMHVWM